MGGGNVAEEVNESYEFTWVGKQEARREAAKPITKTLRPCIEESVDWDTTKNLYIEGDNLEVLKLLQNSYMGKVKMIYIDPPYNTGNDFIYQDDFTQDRSEYDLDAGNVDEEGNRFRKNTHTNGRFHSDWCSMMYSRLLVARKLLRNDGAIFISIGVEELSNLKSICDEIFGEQNFIEIFSWVKTSTPPSLAIKSRKTNEYILCYEKNRSNIEYEGEKLDGGDQPLLNSGNPKAVLKFPEGVIFFNKEKFPNGIYSPMKPDKVKLLNEIEIVDGYTNCEVLLEGEFKWTQEFLNQEIAKGTTFIIKSNKLSIRFIRNEEGYKKPTNFIPEKYTTPIISKKNSEVGTNENASSELAQLMGKEVFSYPKPVSLVDYILNFVCRENDIVMDFFSGSGTTAEAVFTNNLKHRKNLQLILVQLAEDLDANLKVADQRSKLTVQNGITLLDSIGKPHKLTELAKERIRRAGKQIKNELDLTSQTLDVGFRVFKCDESNMKDVYFEPKDLQQQDLINFMDNIKEDRTDLDLLFDCMLKWGVQLSEPIEKKLVGESTIYNVNDGNLVACFSEKITREVIDQITSLEPLRVVFRDGSFEEASEKMNLFEIFKQKCDWSDDEVRKNVRVI